MRPFSIFLLAGLFGLLHCTREPATADSRSELTLPAVTFTPDHRYLAADGGAELLIGVDAYEERFPSVAFAQLIERLQANGGNYLRINPLYLDSAEVVQSLATVISRGMVVDTASVAPLASVSRSVVGFNRKLLAGEGRVAYGNFSQAALNGLRAVRTVERHLPLSTVEARDDILGGDNPTGATAAADAAGNFLIYIPSEGQVTINLPDSSRQPRRRVTVVGHLGTQRSEILRPPYSKALTLLSNEAKGGWMIIERLVD
ncbi:hypothetical protein GGR26_001201 [Lewinella marina]|uniref:Uncharacterized protein n=1 Tax=Neolewinella marina TaxID=438751 RepID=A0A2G0CFU5_9BACT|nr:hypothetical protein [Neolewinella marina]NJB85456.1 hypothetical protein [Neolewinella marina]PHK98853.1 hypothetical protein CGL56_10350 [Neolewinella marina]